MRRAARLLVAFFLVVMVSNCTGRAVGGQEGDVGLNYDLAAVQPDSWWGHQPDIYPWPSPDTFPWQGADVYIESTRPGHLQTNLKTLFSFELVTYRRRGSETAANKILEQYMYLKSEATGHKIKIEWTHNNGLYPSKRTFSTFRPAVNVAEGEYRLQVLPNKGKIDGGRNHICFHTNALPRVIRIKAGRHFAGAKLLKDLKIIRFYFSEPVDQNYPSFTVERLVGGSFQPVKHSVPGAPHGHVELSCAVQIEQPLDYRDTLRLRLKPSVGAESGAKLDGKYTGKAGSGDFKVIIDPKKWGTTETKDFVWDPPYCL